MGTDDQCPCPGADVGGTGELEGDVGGTGIYGEGNTEAEQPQGGTGTYGEQDQGGTGMYGETDQGDVQQNVVIIEDEAGQKPEAANKGFGLTADGGVAGYTGDLAPNVEPGGAWGVTATAQPTTILGLELGYAGAVNNVSDSRAPDARITRNGGTANLKVSLLPRKVEPYVLGGVGFHRANVTDAPAGSGYSDDTFGTVPVGGGIDFHFGAITAGVRGTYELLFDREFSPNNDTGIGLTGNEPNIWNGIAQIGAQF